MSPPPPTINRSLYPVGLVPDLVWATAAGVTASTAENYRRKHRIPAHAVKVAGGAFPGTNPQVWAQWVHEWGADRVRAWLAEYRPELVGLFERDLPNVGVHATKRLAIERERGPVQGSAVWRILQALPATRDAVREAMSDVPTAKFAQAWCQAKRRGLIRHIADWRFEAVDRTAELRKAAASIRELPGSDGDEETDEDRSDSEGQRAFAEYRYEPDKGPQQPCPAFGTVALGVCLDNYVNAAAGCRNLNAACIRCEIGTARRVAFAGHDWRQDPSEEM